MNGYRIKKRDNKWRFILYPNNNSQIPQQPIGESKDYTSFDECINALTEFRKFVIDNNLHSFVTPQMNQLKKEYRLIVQYIKNDEVIFSTRSYGNKQNRDTGIKSIYKFIEEYTTNNLDK